MLEYAKNMISWPLVVLVMFLFFQAELGGLIKQIGSLEVETPGGGITVDMFRPPDETEPLQEAVADRKSNLESDGDGEVAADNSADGKVFDQIEIVTLAQMLINFESADIPLARLIEGGDEWTDLVSEFGESEVLSRAMVLLRASGLAEYPEDDFYRAEATDLGKQVNDYILSLQVETNEQVGTDESLIRLDEELEANDVRIRIIDPNFEPIPGGLGAGLVADWYRFSVPEEGIIRIDVNAPEDSIDSTVELSGPDNPSRFIARNDDWGTNGAGEPSLDSFLDLILPAGTFYIKLADVKNIGGPYKVQVTTDSGVEALSVNSPVEGVVTDPELADWYEIQIDEGGEFKIEVETEDSGLSPAIGLFGPGDSTHEIATQSGERNTKITLIQELSAGKYYLKVGSQGGIDTGTYTARVVAVEEAS
jgi:hypothetical protein